SGTFRGAVPSLGGGKPVRASRERRRPVHLCATPPGDRAAFRPLPPSQRRSRPGDDGGGGGLSSGAPVLLLIADFPLTPLRGRGEMGVGRRGGPIGAERLEQGPQMLLVAAPALDTAGEQGLADLAVAGRAHRPPVLVEPQAGIVPWQVAGGQQTPDL